MIAEVLASGTSWYALVSVTPIARSGAEQAEELLLVGQVRAGAVAERVALAALLAEPQLRAHLAVVPLGEPLGRRRRRGRA